MKTTTAFLSALLTSGLLLSIGIAQPLPAPPGGIPAPAPGGASPSPDANTVQHPTPINARPTITRRGTIRAFNIGPNGETNGFVLRDGTTVMLPPQSGTQLRAFAKEGSRVAVNGMIGPAAPGQSVITAQTITSNGQTLAVSAPPSPAPDPNAPPPAGVRGDAARRSPPLPPAGRPAPPAPGATLPPSPNGPPPAPNGI